MEFTKVYSAGRRPLLSNDLQGNGSVVSLGIKKKKKPVCLTLDKNLNRKIIYEKYKT